MTGSGRTKAVTPTINSFSKMTEEQKYFAQPKKIVAILWGI